MRLDPQGGNADDQPGGYGGQHTKDGRRPEGNAVVRGQDGGGVCARPEEGNLSEMDLAGHPQRQVQPDGQQREDDSYVDDLHGVGAKPVGQRIGGRYRGRSRGQSPAAHARLTVDSPKMPEGRIITTMAKATKVT